MKTGKTYRGIGQAEEERNKENGSEELWTDVVLVESGNGAG